MQSGLKKLIFLSISAALALSVTGCASAGQKSRGDVAPVTQPPLSTSEVRDAITKGKHQSAFDLGYMRGQADQAKRHYWMLQAQHRSADDNSGTLRYYTVQAHEQTEDGRVLVPHTVTIPIVE